MQTELVYACINNTHARNHMWHVSDNHQAKRSYKIERKQSRVHVRVGREKWERGNDATILSQITIKLLKHNNETHLFYRQDLKS